MYRLPSFFMDDSVLLLKGAIMSVSLTVDGFKAPWVVSTAENEFAELELKHEYNQGPEIMAGWAKKEEIVAKFNDVFPWHTNMGWSTFIACISILDLPRGNLIGDPCGILDYEGCPETIKEINSNEVELAVLMDGRMSTEDGERFYRGKCEDIVKMVQLARLTGRDIYYG